jgi:hypothetical protein
VWGLGAIDTTLTLSAAGDVNINAAITATRGSLVVCCGQDVNVNAAITTTNGSVLLSAGRDVNILRTALNNATAITATDGNIAICAGNNINLSNTFNPGLAPLMTLTRGSVTAGQDLATLGVARGLTLMAGTSGTGPGAAGGTVVFTNGGLGGTYITTTGPAPVTPTNIFYNPSSYATPTNYSTFFTGDGSPLTQYMLVFPGGADKTFDGTTTASFTGLKGAPAGVTLNTAAGIANFDTAAVGTGKTISYTGFTLTQAPIVTGGAASNFALPVTCCAPIVGKTTANILAVVPVPAPIVPVLPEPVTPPAPLTPPFSVPPLVVAPETPELQTTESAAPLLYAAGLNLAVIDTGVRMPPVQLAARPPLPPAPVIVPPEAPPVVVVPREVPPVYVPPLRPRKPDRN